MKLVACFPLFAACTVAVAIAGGKTSTSLGPVKITPDLASFENRYADLGGVLDHKKGLIWGYDAYSMHGFGVTLDGSSGLLTIGANAEYLDERDYLVNFWSDPKQGNDPTIAGIYYDALIVAEKFAWRLPTAAEARDAVSGGLFPYGATGQCNIYFGSPTYSQPAIELDGASPGWKWTSDLGGKVKGGFDSAWYWDYKDGSAALIGNSSIPAIWVRTASPSELGQ